MESNIKRRYVQRVLAEEAPQVTQADNDTIGEPVSLSVSFHVT
jgi:hypothetical protein